MKKVSGMLTSLGICTARVRGIVKKMMGRMVSRAVCLVPFIGSR